MFGIDAALAVGLATLAFMVITTIIGGTWKLAKAVYTKRD